MATSSDVREFASTRWSLIVSARNKSVAGRAALEQLCQQYWFPVYAYVRRRGYQSADACDLTQELFAGILAREGFADADPEKGRFRSYLLGAIKHRIADSERKRRAKKRGGDRRFISFDLGDAEQRLQHEPSDSKTPEQVFEYRWASQLLSDTMCQLDDLNTDADRKVYYYRLRELIAANPNTESYAQLAMELGVSQSALRVQVHRLRKKFRELLRLRIADTLADPSDLDDELTYLMNCLRIS